MNSNKSNDLIEKYLAGETSLEEERQLFSNKEIARDIEPWSTYVNESRVEIPASLNDNIRNAIASKKRKNQRSILRVLAAAATIALLISGYLLNTGNTEMAYAEKEAVLNEALAMFPQETGSSNNQKVIYEDELVVIYQNIK